MKVVIIEDENIMSEYLAQLLVEVDDSITVLNVLTTLASAKAFFTHTTDVDLIFMDVELPDGISLKLFEEIAITAPVIITTGHRGYALDAFKANGIDYIMKPYSVEDVQFAIKKYKIFERHINSGTLSMLRRNGIGGKHKKILIAKKGIEFWLLKVEQIVCLFSENFIVFAFDIEGKKFIIDTENLTSIEEELDPAIFFRASRKYIINIEFITTYKVVDRVKLQVEMTVPLKDPVKIGQERAKEFKRWIKSL
jgi:DNA-binding LytR/AlgR family response regulator